MSFTESGSDDTFSYLVCSCIVPSADGSTRRLSHTCDAALRPERDICWSPSEVSRVTNAGMHGCEYRSSKPPTVRKEDL